ncbi:hypothetical protein KP509_02G034900 [Ceratopteris richardii]|uniref:Uncharacterized protein n=1 Tax=Ceratopteris richardii TaxID=49495 RepID=A0A8T2VBT1_CERRI|nr:hypothetical protein KP509_02G034900 [Ceratopteris richardii]
MELRLLVQTWRFQHLHQKIQQRITFACLRLDVLSTAPRIRIPDAWEGIINLYTRRLPLNLPPHVYLQKIRLRVMSMRKSIPRSLQLMMALKYQSFPFCLYL